MPGYPMPAWLPYAWLPYAWLPYAWLPYARGSAEVCDTCVDCHMTHTSPVTALQVLTVPSKEAVYTCAHASRLVACERVCMCKYMNVDNNVCNVEGAFMDRRKVYQPRLAPPLICKLVRLS